MVFLRFHVLYLFHMMCHPYTARVHPSVYSQVKHIYAVTSLSTVVNFTVNCGEL